MKKLLLALAGLLSMQSVVVAQDDNPVVTVDGMTFTIKGEEASLTYGGDASGEIVIPSEVQYEGKAYPVTSVANFAFMTWSGPLLPVTSVEFPASLRRIGENAFGRTAIRELEIPETVDSIGSRAFSGCADLKKVTLNGGKGNLESSVFSDCESLENVVIGEGHTVLPSGMFSYCSLLTDVSLPSTLKEMSMDIYTLGTFSDCSSLKTIELPEGLTSIGNNAFYNAGLESITLPKALTSLGTGVFYNCMSLHDVKILSAIKILPQRTFNYCSTLESIEIPDDIEVIEPYCFYCCNSLKEIKLSENLKEIGESAFESCTALPKIMLPNSLVTLGNNAFSNCSSLQEIHIDKKLETIGYGCFGGNSSLERISVDPENQYFSSVDGILADKQCTELIVAPKNISGTYTLPASIRKLKAGVFANCEKLTGLVLNSGLEVIEDIVIEDCILLKELEIPASVNEISTAAFSGNSLDSFTIDEANLNYSSVSGLLMDKTGEIVIKVVIEQDQITLPASVVEIGDYAFSGSSAKKLTFNEGLKKIGKSAFAYTPIETVNFSSTVTTISEYAFSGCRNLKSLTLPNSICELGEAAFQYSQIEELEFGGGVKELPKLLCGWCSNLRKVDLKGVEKIGEQAFFENAMDSVFIPATVTFIGQAAFNPGWSHNLRLVRCYAKNPPVLESGAFFPQYSSDMEVQVPYESLELYRNAEEWKNLNLTYIPEGLNPALRVECFNEGYSIVVGFTKEALAEGQNYLLSYKIKGIDLSGDITMTTSNSTDNSTVYHPISVTSEWVEHRVEFTPTNSDATGIVWYTGGVSGAFLLDDVVLTKEGSTENLMGNGDFEKKGSSTWSVPGWWSMTENAISIVPVPDPSSVEVVIDSRTNAAGRWTVYSIDGRKVLDTTDESKVKSLRPGLYIINGKKILVH